MEKVFKIIDNHVHIAGRGDVYPDDLYWSKKFKKGIGFKGLKILKGWTLRKVGDTLMRNALLKQTRTAEYVDYVVVLALDNVYDGDGTYRGPKQPDKDKILSTLYISNRYVDELCNQGTDRNLLMGMSVHPFRDDAVAELDRFHERAVLNKWMASAQLLDFDAEEAQPKLEKFYKRMAEIKLPLLYHTGIETSIPAAKDGYDKFNSPIYIKKALDMGVTVILAHCGCSYFDKLLHQDNFVKETVELFETLQKEKKDWNLYADISALFSPFRKRKILTDIFARIPAERLIYGSDWPNPAKGRREFFLRPFLRYSYSNLVNRYYKISLKWLRRYFSEGETFYILTNLHRLLDKLGRGHLIK